MYTEPPKVPHNPDLELALNVATLALDMAEKGRAPAGDVARLRAIVAKLGR